MDKPVVISILSLNNCDLLKQCLESVFSNTDVPYRVCVVNQASNDGTKEYLDSLGGRVDAIHSPRNLGFVAGNNLVMERYPENDIVLLNNDTIVKPGWLRALVECAYSDSKIGIVGAKLVYPDGRLQEAGGEIFQDGSGRNIGKYDDPGRYIYNLRRDVDYCSGACLYLKRLMLDQIGYLDPIFSPAYWEDTDLCFRARKHGWRVVYEPKAEVIHIEGATSGLPGQKTLCSELQKRNKPKFMARWGEELKKQRANVFEVRSDSGKDKILIIQPFLPMYDRAAGEKRWFYTLQILNKYFDIVFLARNGQGQIKYINELEKMGITVFHTDQSRLALMGCDIAGPIWIDFPLLLKSNDFKAIIVGFYHVAHQYWQDIRKYSPQSVFIIDSYDLAFVREYRKAKLSGDPNEIWKALETKRIELAMYQRADMVLTVTEHDKRRLLEELPNLRVGISSDIHAIGEFQRSSMGKDLVFVGNFNHQPNEDGVLYFIEKIFPLVKQDLPDVRFYIVGNNPTKRIQDLQSDDIIVTGFVPDVIPYLLNSRVFVCPLRYGSGLKGKIGEALVTGIPIVTTSIGAEGMGFVDGVNGLVADSPEEFAKRVVEVYTNEALWQRISGEGKRHGQRLYSFETAETYWKEIIEFIKGGRPKIDQAQEDLRPKGFVRNKSLPEIEPNLSIIIPAYNNLADLRACWMSIRKNTSIPYRLIVIDNGSTEEVAYEADQNNIEVIRNPNNMGFAYACNQGIKATNGDYVVILNSDTIVTPGWLERLLWHMEHDPKVGIVGPSTNFAASVQQIRASYKTERELYDFSEDLFKQNRRKSLEVEKIVGVCMLMRRSMLEEIGLFDTRFGLGNYEDDDICLRARIAGYKILWAQDVFVHHAGSKTFRILDVDYKKLLEENRTKFNQKWGSILERSQMASPGNMAHPSRGIPLLILPFSCEKPPGVTGLDDTKDEFEIVDLGGESCSRKGDLANLILDFCKQTDSEHILFLRHGTVLTPDWWKPLIEVLSDKTIGCSLSASNQGIGDQTVRASYRSTGRPLLKFARRNALVMKGKVVDLRVGLPVAMALRKEVVLASGLPYGFQTSGILVDLQRRIRDQGLRVVCVKASFVHSQEPFSDEEDAVISLIQAADALKEGDVGLAISHAEKTVELKPDYQEGLYQLGVMLSLAGRSEEALEKFGRLLRLNPRNSRALNNIGCLWFTLGNIENAEKALKEAIQCDSTNWEAKKNLAELYLRTQRFSEAAQIYSSMIDEHKSCPEAMVSLAEMFVCFGDVGTAEMILKIVLRNSPGNRQAKQLLESLKRFQGEPQKPHKEIAYATE